MTSLGDYQVPAFRPHPGLRGGHRQTLAAYLFPGTLPSYRAAKHRVAVDDGDQIVLHDDCPDAWRDGDRSALLIHGLGGCHESAYMRRIADKLRTRGVRAFRMDLRGCGAGVTLARLPYHSGRSPDAAAALRYIARLCPSSPTTLVGFSLGGNIALKLLGECGHDAPGNVDSGLAVSPPVDLAASSARLGQGGSRLYDRYFARLLHDQILAHRRLVAAAAPVDFPRRPARLVEIDDWFTAPVCGFGTAANYYREASSAPLLADIRLPTLILAAADDPLIPFEVLTAARLSPTTVLRATRHGGHLGYVGAAGVDPDRRWLDWRVVEWIVDGPHALRRGGQASAIQPATQ